MPKTQTHAQTTVGVGIKAIGGKAQRATKPVPFRPIVQNHQPRHDKARGLHIDALPLPRLQQIATRGIQPQRLRTPRARQGQRVMPTPQRIREQQQQANRLPFKGKITARQRTQHR